MSLGRWATHESPSLLATYGSGWSSDFSRRFVSEDKSLALPPPISRGIAHG
jgi:hypothetical protein